MHLDAIKSHLYNRELNKPLLYQPLEHPAFADWEVQQPCVERWQMMLPYLQKPHGNAIDIGCHTGWFCRQLTRHGWTALGIERSPELVNIAYTMNEFAGEHPPMYLNMDVFDAAIHPVDVVLLLSVAMYLFQPEERGWDLLRKVSRAAPMMFCDFGGMYADRLPKAFATQVIARTDYTQSKLLGETALESRPFYVFTR